MKKYKIIGFLILFFFAIFYNSIDIIDDNVVNNLKITDEIIVNDSYLSFSEQQDNLIKDCPFCEAMSKGHTREEALEIVDKLYND